MTTLEEHAQAGMAAINEQRFDDAVKAFTAALAIDSERPDLNSALGMSYMHQGAVVAAIPHLHKANDLAKRFTDPQHDEMRKHFATSLASAYTMNDQHGEALAVLEESISFWPHDVELRMQKGSMLVNGLRPAEGAKVYLEVANDETVEDEIREAAEALAGAIEAFLDDEDLEAEVFLRAHAESYVSFFNQHANKLVEEGWYAEAARMVRGPDGEPKPMLAEGARPWALERVDLVNPADGSVAKVGDEKDPLIVAVNGLEPLAQVPVTLPWSGWAFEGWVCTRVPWHWLQLTVQFKDEVGQGRASALDEVIGSWYLSGYNGDFGSSEQGRFHYATDLERVGDHAVAGAFDLGRASFDAIPDLLKRLIVLNDRYPIRRVVFGAGRLPD